MEDQGKRLMLAVGIAFMIMMAFSYIWPAEQPSEDKSKKEDVEKVAGGNEDGSSGTGDGDGDTSSAPKPAPAQTCVEEFYELNFETVKLRFSNCDASLASYQLMGKRLENRSLNQPEDLIRVKKSGYQFMRVSFPGSTYDIPVGAQWEVKTLSDKEIQFSYKTDKIHVVKTVTVHPDNFLLMVNVKLDLVGSGTAEQSLAMSLYGQEDPDIESGGIFNRVDREWLSACYYDEEIHTKGSKSLANDGEKSRTGQVNWGGFNHAYFLAAVSVKGASNQRVDCNAYTLKGVVGGMGVDVILPSEDLKFGEPGLNRTMAFYMGPKYRDSLNEANAISGIDTKFDESVDLGFLAIIAGPLLSLLNFFQGFVVNWGLAILLLTIVVKAATLPWTHKSMKSMKAMARLKPQLEKIKEKYKDDRARQNVETMSLFKANKVNPMSGCLPMLLQMPIWFALYRSLTVAGELYQAPFIAGWIDDLTLPDPYHVMPVLLTGMMFLQTRLTPSTGTGAQQKMLMYGMPVMFGVFSFFFPAGLTLYIFTNTCFTALHHLYMHKTEPDAATVAASVIDVESDETEKSANKDESQSAGKSSDNTSDKKSSSKGKPGAQPKKSGSKKSGKGKKKRKR